MAPRGACGTSHTVGIARMDDAVMDPGLGGRGGGGVRRGLKLAGRRISRRPPAGGYGAVIVVGERDQLGQTKEHARYTKSYGATYDRGDFLHLSEIFYTITVRKKTPKTRKKIQLLSAM